MGYAFVDDTDLISSTSIHATSPETIATMQKALTMWEGGIRATGGVIVPSKTHWYLIDFKWVHREYQYANIQETPGEIQVRDTDGTLQTLTFLPVEHAE